jgi:hypothetical protein
MTLRKGTEMFRIILNRTGNGGIIQRTPRVPASENLSKCVEIKCFSRVHNNVLKNPQITYIITDETEITSHPFNIDTCLRTLYSSCLQNSVATTDQYVEPIHDPDVGGRIILKWILER